jgi:hypothetical protein
MKLRRVVGELSRSEFSKSEFLRYLWGGPYCAP